MQNSNAANHEPATGHKTVANSRWRRVKQNLESILTMLVVIGLCLLVASPVFWRDVSLLRAYPPAFGHFAGAAAFLLVAVFLFAGTSDKESDNATPGSYILPALGLVFGAAALLDMGVGMLRLFL